MAIARPATPLVGSTGNWAATATLGLALMGLAVGWIPQVGIIGILLAALALVFGVISLSLVPANGGLIPSVLGVGLAVGALAFSVGTQARAMDWSITTAPEAPAARPVVIKVGTPTSGLGATKVPLTITNLSGTPRSWFADVRATSPKTGATIATTVVDTGELARSQTATVPAVFYTVLPTDAVITVTPR